jgi:hypothetical protein
VADEVKDQVSSLAFSLLKLGLPRPIENMVKGTFDVLATSLPRF